MHVTDWVMAILLLAFAVLVVTHPYGFTQDTTVVGNEGNTLLGTLTGKGQGS